MSTPASPSTVPSAAGPASASSRVLAQARFETGIVLRNGEQLLVSFVLPALALVALLTAPVPGVDGPARPDIAMAGVLGLAVVSVAFTGQAISTGFDRRYGVLRLLGTTPLGRGGLLAAKALAVLAVLAVQVLALGALGVALGWRPAPLHLLSALPVLALGAWAFVALALLLAGTLRAEAVLALANLVWVLLLALGGLVIPPQAMPAPVAAVVTWLPSGALGEGMRSALVTGAPGAAPPLVLLVWAVAGSVLASRFFTWSD